MTGRTQFDVVVIGGGPGGVTAAVAMAAAGLQVALVEDRLVGGECHFYACNPTKALLRPIEVLALAKSVPGVRETLTAGVQLDIDSTFAKRDVVIDHHKDDQVVAYLGDGVEVVSGHGRLVGKRAVTVVDPHGHTITLHAVHAVVLATGTRPAIPDVPGLAQARPWTNRELATMTHLPARTLVVGGGVVGVEFATILAGLGAEVTQLVRGSALLHHSEPFAAEMVERSLRDNGVQLLFKTELSSVSRPDPGGPVTANFGEHSIEVDEIVVAAGRAVNTDDLGLASVGLIDGDFVSVDDHLQSTGVEGSWLYAIGDTTGRALLSHITQYHGRLVAEVIAARAGGRAVNENSMARDSGTLAQVIFTDPQVAEVGLTEAQAREHGYEVVTRTASYPEAVPHLSILRDGLDARGKLVIDADTDTIVGATFVGPQVAELIHAATLAVVAKIPLSVLRHAVPPHPSLNQVWDPLIA